MSTMSIDTSITAPATQVRTRLRLTQRGRRVVAALAAAPLVAVLGVSILSGGAAAANPDQNAPATSFTTVTVMSGDTLWSIAQQYGKGHDLRDVVADIERLNNLQTSTLQAGQSIAIPSEYDTAR